MPVFSPKTTPSSNYKIRSISFPARSHPTIRRIEENLNKLTTNSPISSSANAETILVRLSGLRDTYKCVEDFFQIVTWRPSQDDKWVVEMLEDLIRFLDICNTTKDSILSMKESVRQLQSSLRRSKAAGGDISSFENDVNAYFTSRKKMKKEAKKFLSSLKLKQAHFAYDNNAQPHLLNVIKALREANRVVFSSILVFLSAPILKAKSSTGSKYWPLMLSKLVGGKLELEFNANSNSNSPEMNEMQKMDVALNNILLKENIELEYSSSESALQRMLEDLDLSMEQFEIELECLFRHLIHTRVTLLNIVSHSN